MTKSLEKIMEEVEINVDGLTDEIKSYELTPEQYEWFLLQATKVPELEKKIRVDSELFEKQVQINKRYKEALEFYEDEENYEPLTIQVGRPTPDGYKVTKVEYPSEIEKDNGEKARQALRGEST